MGREVLLLRRALCLFDEPGEVAGLLEGPDKLVGVLVQLDLNFIGELPLTVAPADSLFPRNAIGRWIHEQHPREHRQILPRTASTKRSDDGPLPTLPDDGRRRFRAAAMEGHARRLCDTLAKFRELNPCDSRRNMVDAGVVGSNLEEFARLLLDAVTSRNYALLAALVVVVLVDLLRKFGGGFIPFFNTDRGGAVLVLGVSLAGAVANALAAGAPFTLALLLTALQVALTAAGGFTIIKRILFRSAAIARAELAGALAAGQVAEKAARLPSWSNSTPGAASEARRARAGRTARASRVGLRGHQRRARSALPRWRHSSRRGGGRLLAVGKPLHSNRFGDCAAASRERIVTPAGGGRVLHGRRCGLACRAWGRVRRCEARELIVGGYGIGAVGLGPRDAVNYVLTAAARTPSYIGGTNKPRVGQGGTARHTGRVGL
ncbi:hypothetical protein SAMN05444383_113109 [Myxococcus xanthus]|nr:hypothetical protein SAMN05444383_113109 [Myxococcus xanthus]